MKTKYVTWLLMIAWLPGPLFALTLEEVVQRVDQTVEVQRAVANRDQAVLEVSRVGAPGDPSFQATPGVRATGAEGEGVPQQWNATLSLAATIPLGLTTDQQSRLARAEDSLMRAELLLEQTRDEMIIRLRRLYYTAWLAGEETRLVSREVDLLGERSRLERLRFERGEIAWDALVKAEGDYRAARTDLAGVEAAWRDAGLSLALALGAEPREIADLAAPDLAPPDLDELSGGSSRNDTALLIREIAVQSALREASLEPSRLGQLSLRLGAEFPDHSAAATWSLTAETLSLSYSPRMGIFDGTAATSGSGSSGTTNNDWTVSLGVTIGLNGIAGARADTAVQEAIAAAERLEMTTLQAQLQAADESALAAVEQAQRAVARAEDARERADLTFQIVQARAQSGQIRQIDHDLAELETQRAQYALQRALINLDMAIREYQR